MRPIVRLKRERWMGRCCSGDKSGNLTAALDNFIMRHPRQEEQYMQLLHQLFPEPI